MHWLKKKNTLLTLLFNPQLSVCYLIYKGFVHWLSMLYSRSFVKVYFSCVCSAAILNHILQLQMANKPSLPELFSSILHIFNDINQPIQCHHICRALFLWQPDHFNIIRNLTFELLVVYMSQLPELLGARLCPLPLWLPKPQSPKILFS